MPTVIQVKRGTASSWTSANTVLAAGEMGFETDTKKMKVGDGSTAWTSLTYTVTDGDISGVTAGTGLSGGGASGAVTLTNDMATTITANGDLIYGTGSGAYTRRAIGSSGQLLTVSGGIPTWATPTASGMTLISTTSFSGATTANVDSLFTSTYTSYKIILSRWNTSGNTLIFKLRYGSTTLSSNYYGSATGINSNGTSQSTLSSAATSFGAGFDNQTGSGVLEMLFTDVGTSAIQPMWSGIWNGHGNYTQLVGGQLNSAFQTFTGLQFLSASGNVSGTVSVYGLAK